MKVVRALFALGSALILTGCSWLSPATNVVEEISPTILMYLSQSGDSELECTIVVPAVKNEKKQVLTVRGRSMKETRLKLNFIHNREFKSGQMRMLFLSEDLARGGVIRHLNTLLLDQEITDRLYLAVVRGDFAGFLREQIRLQKNYDRILYKRFRHYENQVTQQKSALFSEGLLLALCRSPSSAVRGPRRTAGLHGHRPVPRRPDGRGGSGRRGYLFPDDRQPARPLSHRSVSGA